MSGNKSKRVLVFGYFGYVNNQLDGQTIKTRAVYELIRERMPEAEISYLDSQELQSRPLHTLLRLLKAPFGKNCIVYLPGENNLNRFFPLLYRLSRLAGAEIVYPVVGGWLPDFVSFHAGIRNKLRKIRGVLVESERMVCALRSMGFKNVEILENFRSTDFKPSGPTPHSGPVRFVFMARLCREKGCDIILNAVDILKRKHSGATFAVDFYGPQTNGDYAGPFLERIKDYPNVEYRGTIQPNDVFATLARYDCLLLPTFYEGEGFPGSIVDSFFAGIPVIVTDWKDLASFIQPGVTGFVIPPHSPQALASAMDSIISDPGSLGPMKAAAYDRSKRYSASAAWQILSKYL